jgi:hypothetical protein
VNLVDQDINDRDATFDNRLAFKNFSNLNSEEKPKPVKREPIKAVNFGKSNYLTLFILHLGIRRMTKIQSIKNYKLRAQNPLVGESEGEIKSKN